MKRMLAPLALLLLCGADDCNGPVPPAVEKADPRQLTYIRDNRTGFCFAKYDDRGTNTGASSIVLVSCDPLDRLATAAVEEYK
jgi:hypothetical protein